MMEAEAAAPAAAAEEEEEQEDEKDTGQEAMLSGSGRRPLSHFGDHDATRRVETGHGLRPRRVAVWWQLLVRDAEDACGAAVERPRLTA